MYCNSIKLTLAIFFYSSTPNESELLEINLMMFYVEDDEVSQVIIPNEGGFDENLIDYVDSRTGRVHATIAEPLFLAIQVPGIIHLEGLATVEDTTIGTQLGATFSLDLEVFESVSCFVKTVSFLIFIF
jgi:hypothetical protein